jgi:hypothetical protein
MNPDDVDCDDETKDSSVRYEWWASSMLRHAGKNHTTLMAKNLMVGGHDHIGSWLPDLSLPARRFFETIEELLVRHEPCAGSIPRGWRTKATYRANWSPLPWLNLPHLCKGGTEIHTAITDLLSQRGGIGGADGLRGIQKTIPIARLPRLRMHRRVITSLDKGYWKVELTLDQRALEPPVTLPAHSVVPPLPPCLRPVVDYLEHHFLSPTHMSSDASFEYAGDKPSSLFSQASLSVRNATGCVMVADNSFLPKQSPP